MRFRYSYHPYAIITILLWSLAYVFTRLALRYFSVFSLGFLRYIIASFTLLVICFFVKIKLPRVKDWKWFALAGGMGFFAYMLLFNIGSKTVTASTSSIIIATSPVITALLARILFKERLTAIHWTAIAIEFAGIMILTLFNGIFSINIGILWLLLASVVFSVYNLLQRKLTKTYSALQSSAYSIFAGTILLSVFLPGSVNELQKAPANQLFYIAILGIFPSAIAYITWSKAFGKAEKASYVSNYSFVTPFLASVLGYLIAGEVPDLPTIIGGIVILSGVLVFYSVPKKVKV